jgi:hypothetical protein
MNTRKFFYGLIAFGLTYAGAGLSYYMGEKHEQDKPAVFVHGAGIFACGKMYAVVLSDSKGGVVAVTPHSPNADEILKATEALPPLSLVRVNLEVGCAQPDTSADRSR